MPTPILNKYISPKWVFLDLDDTLWDFHANSEIALKILYNSSEYLSQLYPDYQVFSDVYHRENNIVWNLYHHALISAEELKRRRFAVLLDKFMPEEKAATLAMELNEKYLDTLGRQTLISDGAEELLQHLSERYLIGVLSNGFIDVQYRKLYSSPLWRYVQRMVVSDEIGITKPDARIFRHAEAAVGALPGECVMIGDNPDADICGALDAGWNAIYYNRHNRPLLREGAAEVSSLRDIIGML